MEANIVTKETPVVRLLAEKGIPYRALPHSKPVFTCEEAAVERNVPLDEMMKCMVLIDKKSGKFVVAAVPADRRLSMSKLRKELNIKNFEYATPEQISSATGYPKGAIAPVALPANVTVISDEKLFKKQNVNLSSGDPELGIEVTTWHLRKVFQGRVADIAE